MDDVTKIIQKNSEFLDWSERFPTALIFLKKNGTFPDRTTFNRLDKSVIEWLEKNCESLYNVRMIEKIREETKNKPKSALRAIFTDHFETNIFGLDYVDSNSQKEYIIFCVSPNCEKSSVYDITVLHKKVDPSPLLEKYLRDVDLSGIYLLARGRHGQTYFKEYDLGDVSVNVEQNYGKSFLPIHKTIVEKLETTVGGIYMFYGSPGTGKTTYIRNLCQSIKDRTFIFIPANMAYFISDPTFISLLSEHHSPVLIIEDAEEILAERGANNSNMVSTILNISDGMLTSVTKTSIIVTYNTKRNDIDPALMRKGRLKAEYAFEALSTEETNILLAALSLPATADKPMTLAEIYNLKEEVLFTKKQEEKQKRIGFMS